jgi:hypothetical protein
MREALEDYQRILPQLLHEHRVLDFPQNGSVPPRRGGDPLSAPYILRYFQEHPEEMAEVQRHFGDTEEADVHILLEVHLREWRLYNPELARALDDIYLRSTADPGVAEEIRLIARKGFEHAEILIANHDMAITLLAIWFWKQRVDLFAVEVTGRVRRRRIRTVSRHERCYQRYKDLIDPEQFDMISGEALRKLVEEEGLSRSHLKKIMKWQREIHGDPPAPRGRPRKRAGRV